MPDQDGVEIPIRITANPEVAAKAAKALDQVTASTHKAAAAAKVLTAAQIEEMAADTRLKQTLSLMDEGLARNVESTEKLTVKKKTLIGSLKALKHELHNVPGMWQAMAIVKNPVVAAAVAIAMAVGYVAKKIGEANQAARDIKSLDDFAATLEGLSSVSQRLGREQGQFVAGLQRIGDGANTAAEKFNGLTTQLSLAERLQNELEDKTLAADMAGIESSNLSPDQKAKAKAARQNQYDADKETRTRASADQTASLRAWAIAQAERESSDAAAQAGGLRGSAAAAARTRDIAEKAAQDAAAKLAEKAPALQGKITDLEGALQEPDSFGGRLNVIATALKYGVPKGEQPAALAAAKAELDKLTSSRDQARMRADQLAVPASEAERQLQEATSRAGSSAQSAAQLRREQESALAAEAIRRGYQPAIQGQTERERTYGVTSAVAAEQERRVRDLAHGPVGSAVVGGSAALAAQASGQNISADQAQSLAVLQQLLATISANGGRTLEIIRQSAGDASQLSKRITEIESALRQLQGQSNNGQRLNKGG